MPLVCYIQSLYRLLRACIILKAMTGISVFDVLIPTALQTPTSLRLSELYSRLQIVSSLVRKSENSTHMANEARPCPCDIGDRMDYGGLGLEVQIEHIEAYVTKPSSASDKAIIVIQDIYGWQLPNTRYMADMLAANGYIAVCPDFYCGKEPWSPSHDWSRFQEWLEDKKPSNINKEVDAVLRFLKEQCGVKHIGTVGFCWGGAATHYITLQYPEIKAGVSVYGIVREREDSYALKSPTLFIFGEKDVVIPLDQVSALEARLNEKCTVAYQVKIFPGQTHGFVHRKREDINPADIPCIQEARTDMLNWFNKYMQM